MKKLELVSFNEVVRDISSLEELNDETLERVSGGLLSSVEPTCPTDNACEPNCRYLDCSLA